MPADLRRVIAFIVNKREDIIDWRSKRMQLLCDVADSLAALNSTMVAAMPLHVRHVAGTYNVAFIACLVDATDFPDTDLPRCFIYGFPVRGALPRTGLWGEGGSAPQNPSPDFSIQSNIHWNKRLLLSVQQRGDAAARDKHSDAWKAIVAVWDVSASEFDDGWTIARKREGYTATSPPTHRWGGFTPDQLDKHPMLKGRGSYRACRRFGVFQKDKWRPVDDATENGVNDATGFVEKLTLIGADAITHTVQAFEQERAAWESRLRGHGAWPSQSGSAVSGTPDAIEVGLDDVGKAFRTIPSAEPGFMVVAVYNPVTMRAELLLLPSFVFGTLSAVVAWNRVSTLYAHVGRRVAAVPSLEYF